MKIHPRTTMKNSPRNYLIIFLGIKSAAKVAAKQYNWKKRKFLVRHFLVGSQNIDILAISPFLQLRGENKDNLRWWKENIPARLLTASNQIKLGLEPELPNHKCYIRTHKKDILFCAFLCFCELKNRVMNFVSGQEVCNNISATLWFPWSSRNWKDSSILCLLVMCLSGGWC